MAASDLKIPELPSNQTYHAFIAHSSEDRPFTEDLTVKLESAGFLCFMYERDLPPDSRIVTGVVHNIHKSRRVILIVTEAFLESQWSTFEAMEALHKGYSENRMVLVPVLYGISVDHIPHYLRPYRCLEHSEEHFWRLLTKALIEDRPATDLIPAGQVAHGLAWSYYYGFLKIVLPGMRTRSEAFLKKKPDVPEMLKQMVIIIPSTCQCPQHVTDLAPESLAFEGFIDFSASRAGNVQRNYKSSVYRVTDPQNGKQYLFIAEFATPLLSMYEMEIGGISGLTPDDKVHQRMLFSEKIYSILSHPANQECHMKATLFEYDDAKEENRQNFPHLLCEHIRRELETEKVLLETMDEIRKVTEGVRNLDL